jgi:hypothetical protein
LIERHFGKGEVQGTQENKPASLREQPRRTENNQNEEKKKKMAQKQLSKVVQSVTKPT